MLRDDFAQIAVAITLGALLIGGFKSSLLLRGTQLPERITIAQLGAIDGTSNVHLTVTDYRYGKHIVTLKGDETWKRVWIPLLNQEGKWTARPVVVHTKHVKNPAQLNAVLRRGEVTGVVSNFMQSLGSIQREQFAKVYPNDDLRGAIALQLDESMPSPWVAYGLLTLGILTLPFTLHLCYVAFFRPEIALDEPIDDRFTVDA